jgi:hypothetical protein
MRLSKIGISKLKYNFLLSNNENFNDYFTSNEKTHIRRQFRIKQTDMIEFRSIKITRIII